MKSASPFGPNRSDSSVTFVNLLVAKTTPFANCWGEHVPSVKLNVLHGMAKTNLVDTRAASNVSLNLHDGEVVDELLGICSVSHSREL